ncbi:hypothetical protein BCR33DRAFT_800615 [Rhizoclosmatium globosum]|uniref:Uncharacterized protein n=1 Tax=Rhizoclosmatium globosum TaxID=329046 RepID=A0A1Y1ZN49_9FUNG|nr:hypothetical protein BCR33DRAFT_800615 [Rhizoclosmatium globosum]|eukprot:ORY11681.1 hypothetical protein BCR33DRAFT_800615 [Rhizoclosmatium globosum]
MSIDRVKRTEEESTPVPLGSSLSSSVKASATLDLSASFTESDFKLPSLSATTSHPTPPPSTYVNRRIPPTTNTHTSAVAAVVWCLVISADAAVWARKVWRIVKALVVVRRQVQLAGRGFWAGVSSVGMGGGDGGVKLRDSDLARMYVSVRWVCYE